MATFIQGKFTTLTAPATEKHEVDPISRIEGHLGVNVQTDAAGEIHEADVHGNLWRGFENFLLGREPNDAITFTQRICGVCPVPHGMTATFAAESVMGLNDCFQTFEHFTGNTKGVPLKAVIIRNLVLASEFLMSNLTHFYHLAAPSYVQGPAMPPWTPYFHHDDYAPALLSGGRPLPVNAKTTDTPANYEDSEYSKDLWSAVIKQYVHALRIRRLTFEAGALFAGRMPMTSCFVAGGVTNDHTDSKIDDKIATFDALTKEIGTFILKDHVPLALALGLLYTDFDNANGTAGDGWGAGVKNFLSWGAFPMGATESSLLFARASKIGTGAITSVTKALVEAHLTESVAHSHYEATTGVYDAQEKAYPGVVPNTIPDRTKGYSWIKAPRWNGNAMEVGPLARMILNSLYPVNTTFVSKTWPSVGPIVNAAGTNTLTFAGPSAYARTVTGGAESITGVNPDYVAPDLAIGAVRNGLADLWIYANLSGVTHITLPDAAAWYCVHNNSTAPTGDYAPVTTFTTVDIHALSDAEIVTAYGLTSSVIFGFIGKGIAELKGGYSTMDRLRGRAVESLYLVQAMIGPASGFGLASTPVNYAGWVKMLDAVKSGDTWTEPTTPVVETKGFGAGEAPRGALMHQITAEKGKIKAYQCIVPTTWNASPKDFTGSRGPIEEAMVGATFKGSPVTFAKTNEYGTADSAGAGDAVSGVEPLRIAQSFDPCIACAVH